MHALTYHRCRAEDPTGQYFTVNECPVGQVMDIQSAELGYSRVYYPDMNPPQCHGNDCVVHSKKLVKLCHGCAACVIRQEILTSQESLGLHDSCGGSRGANFIRIELTCMTGMQYTYYFLYCFSNIVHMIIPHEIAYFAESVKWIFQWQYDFVFTYEFAVNSMTLSWRA